MMKKRWMGCLMLLSAAGLIAADLPYIRAERDTAVYKVGEDITFRTSFTNPDFTYTVNNGETTSEPQPLSADVITVKAEKPGFILVTVSDPQSSKKTGQTFAGAAIEPEKIAPGATMPADFDTFWQNELKKLRESPLEVVKETPVDISTLPEKEQARCEGIAIYDVTVRRGDVVATGYLAIPKDAAASSLPGCLSFLGASKVSAEAPIAIGNAKKGALSFNLNFHGLENSPLSLREFQQTDLFKASKKATRGYNAKNAENPEKYAMRKIFLRTVVAADYLMQRQEWNGKTLLATGGSLGGCQAFVCAALVPQVTMCVSCATAMCDHQGAKAGHLAGWPDLLKNNKKANESCGYFDVVNFAHLIKCPTYMSVGFIDTTCPPASTYAAYNTLTCEKQMGRSPTSGHGGKCLDKADKPVFSFWGKESSKHLKSGK